MELIAGLESRKSIRAFKKDPVPRKTVEKILKAASNSPSYTNTQPWEVVVVSGKKRDELAKALTELVKAGTPGASDIPMPKSWPQAMADRTKEHNTRRLAQAGIDPADDKARKELSLLNYNFYGAPCVIFLVMDGSLTSWSIFDMGLFAESIVLAVHGMGLGTCIQAMITIYPDVVKEKLGIARDKKLLVGISLGYPDPAAKLNQYKASRADIASFTTWVE